MKKLIVFIGCLFTFQHIPVVAAEFKSDFDIVALGTSNTNCKNVQLEDKFTTVLEKILNEQGIKARVINGGVDGDTPRWMLKRAQELVTDKTKIVLFEPGPNDTYKERSIRDSEKVIEWIKTKNIPIIYSSNNVVQNVTEAIEFSEKWGMSYYGPTFKGMPLNRDYRQYDMPGQAGHMTAKGCHLWAIQMASFVQLEIKKSK
jgi:lysophospholipase L1-like esterase